MYNIERELYRAYERSQMSVLTRMNEGVGRTADADLYAPHVDAVMLQRAVSRLPARYAHVIESKYGLLPVSMQKLAQGLSDEHDLHIDVARVIVLHWLGHKARPSLKTLVGCFPSSYSTLVRKCREICIHLDRERLNALVTLEQKFVNGIS